MITKQRGLFYWVGDRTYTSLEEAQKMDLMALLRGDLFPENETTRRELISDWLLKNADSIVATLTMTPRSRVRKPRSDIGKPRKKKNAPEPATP